MFYPSARIAALCYCAVPYAWKQFLFSFSFFLSFIFKASLVDQELTFDLDVLAENFRCLSQKGLKTCIDFMLR